jgi:hypothetical protein
MILTDWFPGSAKPVRKGVYLRQYPHFSKTTVPQYCYWNGKEWGLGEHTVEQAMTHEIVFMVAPRQCLPWRGVLK